MNTFTNLNILMKAEDFIYNHLFHEYIVTSRWLELDFFNFNQKNKKSKREKIAADHL